MSPSPATPLVQPFALSPALRWFPWVAIAVLLVVRLCHEWFGPDIWYHLALGERIARTGAAQPADNLILQQPGFVNFYWLFQLLVRGVFALGGLAGVSVLFVAVWLAAFAAWLRTTGALRSAPWGFGLALVAVLVCQTRFEERPEIFSFLFLALQIHALARWDLSAAPRRGALVKFTIVQILWSNVHGYFVLGPLLVAAKLISVALETPRADRPQLRPAWRGLWWLAGLSVAATLVSPFGLRNWSGVLALWNFFGAMRLEVQEFLPPTKTFLALWTVKLFWLSWAAASLSALYVHFATARREIFALLLTAAGLWLSATSFRNIPLLVFFTAPLAGVVLRRHPVFHPLEQPGAFAIGLGALGLAIAAAAGTFGPTATFGIRQSPVASPVHFAGYLRTTGFRGALFNHPGDGGYLEFYFPALRLYADSRYVEVEPVRAYFNSLRDPDAFRQLNERHSFDAALFRISDSRAVLRDLLTGARWRLAYADLQRALLVDVTSPSAATFNSEDLNCYRGEDLAVRANSEAALHWIALFAETNDPADLGRLLHALAAAPRVPAVLIEAGLRYALATNRHEIATAARALRPRMIVAKPADADVVDRLIAQTGAP